MTVSPYIAVLAAALVIPTAGAQQSQLVTGMDLVTAQRIVAALDGQIRDVVSTPTELDIVAIDPTGLIFTIEGRVCENSKCAGVEFIVSYDLDAPPDYKLMNECAQNTVAARFSIFDNGLYIQRYEILDHGQHFNNLVLSLEVTLDIGEAAADCYFGDDYDDWGW
ncbi:hypothetical protein FM042_11075 [Aliidiomarina halalkaliphila]|uniref:YbjN domain-containing protein n=1 Tax=Aliidiomarina halalkaliphila TaxID=2593535 RepID=A0A552X019_9GAMM|nr:hypothetical protein [Aliidiomarina halalkaliphila]TRW48189.1 hypothetical protein FM042_11075 [Aliidiomarina halalkaliphila]